MRYQHVKASCGSAVGWLMSLVMVKHCKATGKATSKGRGEVGS